MKCRSLRRVPKRLLFVLLVAAVFAGCCGQHWKIRHQQTLAENLARFDTVISLIRSSSEFDDFHLRKNGEVISNTVVYDTVEEYMRIVDADASTLDVLTFMADFSIISIEKHVDDYWLSTGGFIDGSHRISAYLE